MKMIKKEEFNSYCTKHQSRTCKTCKGKILVKSQKVKLTKVELLKKIDERYDVFEKEHFSILLTKDGKKHVFDKTAKYFKKLLDSMNEEEINEYFLTKI